MDQTLLLVGLSVAAAVGMLATIGIMRRQRHQVEREAAGAVDRPLGISTEGMKRCPACGFGNLVTDDTCVSCGAHLPG